MNRTRLIGAGLLVAVTLLAYAPVLDAGFIWDDNGYVTENRALENLDGLRRIWLEPLSDDSPYRIQYYPATLTTFWVEHQLWGLDPLGYHLVNLLLHAASGLLLWTILRRLELPGAWFVAAVFLIHPVQVESVAWITERKNILAGTLYLASFLCYLRPAGLDGTAAEDRAGARRYYVASLVLFAGALLAKTVSASLPAAMLLVIWWKRGRITWRDVRPLLPMFAMGLALGLTTAMLEKHYLGLRGEDWELSFAERVLIAGRAVWFYAGKLLWPYPLSFNYARWEIDSSALWQWAFPVAASGVLVALWALRHRIGRGPLVAVLYFGGTLVPALGFFDVYPMVFSYVADHFQYMASIGLIALFVAGAVRSWPASAINVRTVVAGVVLLGLGGTTFLHARTFEGPETLWRAVLERNPGSWLAHNHLGILLVEQGESDAAAEHFRAALRVRPRQVYAHLNLGLLEWRRGRIEPALVHLEQTVELEPRHLEARYAYGDVLFEAGRTREARTQYDEALRQLAEPRGFSKRAECHARLGDVDAALDDFRQAIALGGEDPDLHGRIGTLLQTRGQLTRAATHYRQALASGSRRPEIALSLAWILSTAADPALRSPAEAVRLAEPVCEDPRMRNGATLDVLAAAYAAVGRFDDAVRTVDEAIEHATAAGRAAFRDRLGQRRQLYASGRPFVAPTAGVGQP